MAATQTTETTDADILAAWTAKTTEIAADNGWTLKHAQAVMLNFLRDTDPAAAATIADALAKLAPNVEAEEPKMTIAKTAATLTATQAIYGLQRAQRLEDITRRMNFPVHPALASLEWEDERTDVHGIGCRTQGSRNDQTFVTYTCACGLETDQRPSELDAAADLISHALHTCAQCHGEKAADNFPRCSNCAF